ncbi:MAG TPA: mechanosensitive ion channel domain-containing protein [Patescibacteria group bacterium]|nr:mechanosensitive ion channel domain-containing protein [Patescibacteria group bacterium]
MDAILADLGRFAVVMGGRALVVIAVAILLVALYLVIFAVIRRLARRAAELPMAGRGDGRSEDAAIRGAVFQRRLDTLVLVATRLGKAALIGVIAMIGVAILAPEVVYGLGPLGVALGATVGVALGFGAQQLVRDYLNGILILGENPFSVGDFVAVAGIRGTVEEVGLRRTVVRDVDGVVHSVPNGEIHVASNFTRTYARINERFAVAAGTDITRATAVLGEACTALAAADEWRDRFIKPPRVVRLDAAAAGEAGVPILVSATVRPSDRLEAAGELRRRGLDALVASRIDLASGRTILGSRGPAAETDAEGGAEGGAEFT